jgi:hypothetical protein
MHTIFWLVNLKGQDHLDDLNMDEKLIILKWIFGKLAGKGVDWMHLAQNRDHCWALVNTVMNLRVP